ncbi:RagB/SusD family nutrient uptake outer membrane protein [Mucilaginibacter celer]|uniref:RagB/SusD family nutrient uptake outer membrane protein n=1 Tax=Mucilaginibacter celer TaxID=2305508 RepID=A0A494VN90_9SPHI|nr:RagB/SusD family nutrient uptake outer membrane protein [Mucilaginibacter celer]AYL95629.1 RagB/SusD family nutrient uptake outer membrane protein [Mucilaginibacter celer]
MKSIHKYIWMALLAVCAVSSCKKYLDVTPDGVGTIDYAFRNRNEAENYLFTCYSTLQKMQNMHYDAGFTTSGEIVFPNNLSDNTYMDLTGFNILRGLQTSGNPALNYWDGNNGGQDLWQAIRRCNIMLENVDKPVDLSPSEKKRWIAETKFLKAYYHFYLFRLYGPIPVVDKNLDINSPIPVTKIKRRPVDTVVNYMVRLLDEAAPDLPPVIENTAKELGRITSVITLSLKAQILATAASSLFNGNPDYASIKNKDGEALFNPTFDASKWDKASAACLAAITLSEKSGLKLHTYTPEAGIDNLNDTLTTVLATQTAVTARWETNTELIWANYTTFPEEEYCFPRLTQKSVSNIICAGTFAVPISEQELFYTSNGVPITEDKTWDYNDRYGFRTGDDANKSYIGVDYQTVKAHFNREPRFYADLGFDGGVWFGNGVGDPDNAFVLRGRGPESFAGPKDNVRVNVSGYWPKKLVNYLSVYDDGYNRVPYHMPLIRLADIYLLYAEALNEQGKPYTEAAQYIDKVRARAGLKGVAESWTKFSSNPNKFTTKEGMRQIIHQERRIELAFEGVPGYDLRRWKELQGVMSKPLQGWNVRESTLENYYRPRLLATPVFNTRNYLWPIQDNDLIVDGNLVQNLNW